MKLTELFLSIVVCCPITDGLHGRKRPSYADGPILHLSANCPSDITGSPRLQLKTDVSAYAKALCKNGAAEFSMISPVVHDLAGTFESNLSGDCLFHKKKGSNTFTVDVEVGWGETNSEVIAFTKMNTLSCAYDDHGRVLTSRETIADWFMSPPEVQSLLGTNSNVTFALKFVNLLDEEINADHINLGRKIRLMATNATGAVVGFRALSCEAKNSASRYAVLRAGCGDGLIFGKSQGFHTEGNVVYSPFFDAFMLDHDDGLRFECTFTVCTSRCDGSSCVVERRRRAASRSTYHQSRGGSGNEKTSFSKEDIQRRP